MRYSVIQASLHVLFSLFLFQPTYIEASDVLLAQAMTTTVIQRKLNEEYCRNANSIKAMVDSGLTHIPSDFILPQNMQPRFTKSDKSRDVPTIDLSLVNDESERPRIATAVTEAAKEWGVFKAS